MSLPYLIARTEGRKWSVGKTISIAASKRIQGAGNMTGKESSERWIELGKRTEI